MTKHVTIVSLCLSVCLCSSIYGEDYRSRLKGLVFEAEEWSSPSDAWLKDEHPAEKWCLWTKEEDVANKRSGGQSLQSPRITADRAAPEDGAPPLHTHITGIPQGLYRVWMNNPARTIALSFDGQNWKPYLSQGELNLGVHRIEDGSFDLWVDDRYAFPERIGSCYYDYLRFEPYEPPVFSHLNTFTRPDGRTQISWITDKSGESGFVCFGSDGELDHRVDWDGVGQRNHVVVLPDLESGRVYEAQVCIDHDGKRIARSERVGFIAGAHPSPGPTTPQQIPLKIGEPTSVARSGWPVTSGVPFAQGALASTRDVLLCRASGERVPAQFETMARWPDGSVRWLLVDFQANTDAGQPVEYVLTTGSKTSNNPSANRLIRETPDGYLLDPGPLRIQIDRDAFRLPGRITLAAGDTAAIGPGAAELVTADGIVYRAGVPERITVETNGTERGVIRVEGHYVDGKDQPLMGYRMRLTVFRGRPDVRVQWTIGNDRTSDTFAEISSASLRIETPNSDAVTAGLADGRETRIEENASLAVLQDYDDHAVVTRGNERESRERDLGYVRLQTGELTVDAMVRDFWQTYPKGLRVTADAIALDLLPELPANQFARVEDRTEQRQIMLFYCYRSGNYLFKRGMEVATDVMLSFQRDADSDPAQQAAHWQNPLMAVAPAAHYCSSGAFWWVDPQRLDEFPRYAAAFRTSFANLERGRRERHEYGWMNYGDWFGERTWNWGNSEYDLQYVCAVHFARTGDLGAFWRGDQMARHNTTVDVVHYPWQTPMRELVYAHSVGHVGGFFQRDDSRITNRVYSMAGFIDGARDSSGGHTFQGGNFLYGFLTGDRRYLEVAETVCWNQATTYTPNWTFGIERSCGWSLYNAMSAYESTLNPYYLNAAHIYLEKVYELQDDETGGWRMRQGPPECSCPDAPHVGGKAFATGVLLHGMMMVDRVTPDPQLKQSLVRGADWLLDYSWNEAKQGFRYKTGCPKYADHGWYTPLVTDGIAYAYEITKDDRYRDFLLRTLHIPIDKTTGSGPSSGKDFASHFRHLPHTLHFVKSWGVTSLDASPPP